jgi:hypothetical protein
MKANKYQKIGRKWKRFLVLSLLPGAHAVTFEWDHSPDRYPSVIGYRLYWGRTPGAYDQSVMVGYTNAVTVTNPPPGITNFYVVTARNAAGIESVPSNEVRYPEAAPWALGQTFATVRGVPFAFMLPTGDLDTPTSNLVHLLVRKPYRGKLTTNGGPSWVYTPRLTYITQDSFTYRVTDGKFTSSVSTIKFTVSKP